MAPRLGRAIAGTDLRPAVWGYLVAVAALAAAAAALGGAALPPQDLAALAAALAAATALAWLYPLSLTAKSKLYLDSGVLVAAVLLLDPGVALLVVVSGRVLAHALRRQPWYETLFNAAQGVLQVGAGAAALSATGWDGQRVDHAQPAPLLLGLAVGVGMWLLGTLIVAPIVALQTRGSLPRVWARTVVGTGRLEVWAELAQSGLGVLVVALAGDHPLLAALLLLPAFAVYRALVHHAGLRREAEARLVHLAYHDPLTGLPNRVLLLERAAEAFSRLDPTAGSVGALFLDLDGFKFVNDSLGHAAGDRLLVAVADRLRAQARPGDTVARLGGDEFVVLLGAPVSARVAKGVADTLAAALDVPFCVAGQDCRVAASIGIAVTGPGGPATPSDLLRDADVALYHAKQHGRGCSVAFDRGMAERMAERTALEGSLRRALDQGLLRLHFQPLVEFGSGRVVAVEALVRLQDPERGLLAPEAFVPLAEETGDIVPIGQWVLEEACRQARAWEGGSAAAPAVTVNLSARQFRQPGLAAGVARALDAAGLEPHRLNLEITESAMMADAAGAVAILRRLKRLGVGLAIDDFGTGFSSLGRLRRFPFDVLKIDKEFVAGLGGSGADETIVRAIVSLARALGLQSVAEGVETGPQAALLRDLGCQVGQGYHFSRPLPAGDMAALLERGASWPAPVRPASSRGPRPTGPRRKGDSVAPAVQSAPAGIERRLARRTTGPATSPRFGGTTDPSPPLPIPLQRRRGRARPVVPAPSPTSGQTLEAERGIAPPR